MKILLILSIFLIIWTITAGAVNAQTDELYHAFVAPVFPIRGPEFWPVPHQTPADNFRQLYTATQNYQLPATWLFRYDALNDSQIIEVANELPTSHERGLFLEITPSLTSAADVNYPPGTSWSDANRVFISGYNLEERQKLIGTAMAEFIKVYGQPPDTVGAWHIDAWSAAYLNKTYGVNSIVIVADQYGTDHYQLWGGWWGVPYYPSKFNILTPAQTLKNKLPMVVSHWAARDPVNGYGSDVQASTYSVQANDYLQHGLDINYFEKLLDIYTSDNFRASSRRRPGSMVGTPQPSEFNFKTLFNTPAMDSRLHGNDNIFGFLVIGIENDYDFQLYGEEVNRQLSVVAERQQHQLKVVTLNEFNHWYHQNFPQTSTSHIITGGDPLGSGRVASWEMNTDYRISFISQDTISQIRDLRVYNEQFSEPFLETRNPFPQLHLNLPARLDRVSLPDQLPSEEFKIIKPMLLPFSTPAWIIYSLWTFIIIGAFWLGRRQFLITLSILIGSLTWSLTMVKSSLLYSYGMGFWGPNGHDGVWHLSLIEHFSRHWNLNSPILAGEKLTNYHFLFDLLVALSNRLVPLGAITWYFQIIPVLLTLGIGYATYQFMWKWTGSKIAAFSGIFFIYFGGSWGWLVNFIRNGTFSGESMFWANQAISTLINPPFALSILMLLIGLIFWLKYQQKPSLKLLFITGAIFGLIIHAKAYAGILVTFGLTIIALYELIQNGKNILKIQLSVVSCPNIFLWALSLTITLLTFLPLNRTASQLLVFSPLWFPHTMLEFTDRFNWPRLEQARQAYWVTGLWWKAVLAEIFASGIFILGNLGTRIIGFLVILNLFQDLRKNSKSLVKFLTLANIDLFLLTILGLAILLPLLFIQKGNPWNTVQFFYYAQVIMALYAGKAFGLIITSLYKVKAIQLSVVCCLIVLTIPTTLDTLTHYLPYRAPSRIPWEELQALDFLRSQPSGTVLTYTFKSELRDIYEAPKPLAYYETTAYVSAFSGKPVFLEDEMNLEITGANWRPRREATLNFFTMEELEQANQFLNSNKIDYLYLLKNQTLNLHPDQLNLKKIFDNGLVLIYRIGN